MNQPSPPDPEAKTNDRVDSAMRPQRLLDLVGQDKIKDSLAVLIANARKCEGTLDHILLCGPLGYGKSTLAHVMAKEMGVNIKITAGPVIERQGDLAAILTNLREALNEAIEMNREDARKAAGEQFEEVALQP